MGRSSGEYPKSFTGGRAGENPSVARKDCSIQYIQGSLWLLRNLVLLLAVLGSDIS